MKLDFTLDVPQQAQILQPQGETMYRLHLDGGKLMASSAKPAFVGNWNDVAWGEPTQVFNDNDIIDFQAFITDGEYFTVVYTTQTGLNKIGMYPGEFPLYGNKDPYRLYWATDSLILYMNVENTWTPVSVMSPDGSISSSIELTRKEW